MKIYIDFDGTLFDTDKYTNNFMVIFNQYGINKDMFVQVKDTLFSDEKLFNLDMITDYFIARYNIDIELKHNIDNLLNNSYVYSEVTHCLDELTDIGYELYMLTYGNEIFQKRKIYASNLSKYFKEIIITDKDKSELNLDYKNSIFIDNNPDEIKKFSNSRAKTLIRIRRDSDRHTKDECTVTCVIECKDFNEVVQFLKGGFNNE